MSFSRQLQLVVPQLKGPGQYVQQHKSPLQKHGKNLEKSSFKHPADVFRNSLSQKTQVQQHDQQQERNNFNNNN